LKTADVEAEMPEVDEMEAVGPKSSAQISNYVCVNHN